MKTYMYIAYDESGKKISGELEAESSQKVYEILSIKGYIPDTVKRSVSGSDENSILKRLNRHLIPIKTRDLILFTKQFKTMIQAGISMVQIFEIIIKQTENLKLKTALNQMVTDIREGASLSASFKKHQHVFSILYCAMIEAGESSGSLPEILERLIYIIEHEHKVRSDIKTAVRYPAIVLIMLIGVFFFLLTFIVPKFVSIFERINMELPIPTKICIFIYSLIHDYWSILLVILTLLSICMFKYFQTESGKYYRDFLLMRLPLIGPLFVKSAMSRFASIFSILQASGITILESIDILGKTIANSAITYEFTKIKELLTEGRGIANPLNQARYFTPMVVNMTAIGEESGNLDDMLREVAEHYDAEVEYATKSLSDAIAPILTIALAIVVGFVALAIFLPMWNLTNMVQ